MIERTCVGCGKRFLVRQIRGKGYCSSSCNAKARARPRETRFAEKCAPPDDKGCILWTGAINERGYGKFERGRAHRAAWELARGPVPDGLYVLHRCDVRNCVNVDHLFLGTALDNTHDGITKGRIDPMFIARAAPDNSGERNGQAKLTAAQAREIRALAAGSESRRSIGRRFGVSAATVDSIVWRNTWRHA